MNVPGKITSDKELILQAQNNVLRLKRFGGNPIGLAAGAFYDVCKKNKIKISKEKIGEAFRISPRTVYINEQELEDC